MGADVLTRPRCRAPSAECNVSFCCETVTYCTVKVNVTIPEIREREWVQLGTDKAFNNLVLKDIFISWQNAPLMARSMPLIDREPLKIQEGTLEDVAESTCRTIGKGGKICRIKNEKKA